MNHQFPFHYKAEVISLTTLAGSIAGWLPTLALLLPVLWYSYLLVTSIYDRFFRKH